MRASARGGCTRGKVVAAYYFDRNLSIHHLLDLSNAVGLNITK